MDKPPLWGVILVCLLGFSLLGTQVLMRDPPTKTREGITVGIEKTTYRQGELVRFWIYNNRNTTVQLAAKPLPFQIERHTEDGWERVFRPVLRPVFVDLPPGGNKSGGWDQRTSEGTQAPPDRYRVRLSCYTNSGPPVLFYLSFRIIELSASLRSLQSFQLTTASSGQIIPWGIELINARNAEQEVNNGEEASIDVAVIDNGIDYQHPDLDVTWGYNVVNDSEGVENASDPDGHGTHCAGIIAALDNYEGVIGVSPYVDLYAIDAFYWNSTWRRYETNGSLVAEAIRRAVKGNDSTVGTPDDADVISMSIGTYKDYWENFTGLENAVEWAYQQGTVLVAAVGNYIGFSYDVEYPAKFPEVIGVGATNQNDEVAEFSKRGDSIEKLYEVEVAAPGVEIYSTNTTNIDPDGYSYATGTSMACPHVAGTIALIMAAAKEAGKLESLEIGNYNSDGHDTIRGVLHNMCVDIEENGTDLNSGYGRIDAFADDPTLNDKWDGDGLSYTEEIFTYETDPTDN
ncbi:MAG: S8 family peptidase, partial [Candidatus Korarchaeota archaeon]|nr:S8 family peptidase [Candidatus Korarchaeota archaeon]NIU82464.1 S8 family serine peptidase [Candidatus Thorarchaeota archaeon]NIW15744.1 S8 family serine peptidase [Candidatus Thorarchaeota archaeon]NIW51103.1 S8 family serine peptidase [Candidatus Korarchaeota archaeon]